MANQVNETSGKFLDTMAVGMAELKYGITSWKRGVQPTRNGGSKTVFIAVNSRGKEMMRGLVSEALALTGVMPSNAQISTVEYVQQSTGEVRTTPMLHLSNSQVEFEDFVEAE